MSKRQARVYYDKDESNDLLDQINDLIKTIIHARKYHGDGFALLIIGFVLLVIAGFLYFFNMQTFFWVILFLAIILFIIGIFFLTKERGFFLEKCPLCKSKTIKKKGRYGEYVSCIRYPGECKYARSLK